MVLAGPLAYALETPPRSTGTLTVALVQPGVVHSPAARFASLAPTTKR